MTTYRHRVYLEAQPYEKLAALGAQAGSVITKLSYVPHVNFFREDPAGRYPRAVRCSGFCDYRSSATNFDVFVRGGLTPAETVEVVFHECEHIAQFHNNDMRKHTQHDCEARAYWIGTLAPSGSTYSKVYGELSFKLTKWFIRTGDINAAQKYHRELQSVDPETAAKLADDVMSPTERRLRRKIAAEKELRMAEIDAFALRRREEFQRWRKTFDESFGGSRW